MKINFLKLIELEIIYNQMRKLIHCQKNLKF